jgi:hypothetical protein
VLKDFKILDVEGLVLIGVGLLAAVGGELVGRNGHGADVVFTQALESDGTRANPSDDRVDVGERSGEVWGRIR